MERGTFLYLADGRIFVRRVCGEIREANTSERADAERLLLFEEFVKLDPRRRFELAPFADN